MDFPCVPGQKAFSWDDHASVWNIFKQMKIRLPVLDQVVAALVEDIYERGLQDEVLLAVMGEMSHTPKLSNYRGQPGREHWAQTMSVFLAGGGLRTGQSVGATNARGDEVRHRQLTPGDLLATWYRHLGVPLDTHFTDATGRALPILPQGEPIRELVGWGGYPEPFDKGTSPRTPLEKVFTPGRVTRFGCGRGDRPRTPLEKVFTQVGGAKGGRGPRCCRGRGSGGNGRPRRTRLRGGPIWVISRRGPRWPDPVRLEQVGQFVTHLAGARQPSPSAGGVGGRTSGRTAAPPGLANRPQSRPRPSTV